MLEMGDFAGGLLKYLRRHPVDRVSIGGGVAKMTKLAQGFLDLHSRRGQADMTRLGELAHSNGAPDMLVAAIAQVHSVASAFALAADAGYPLGPVVAQGAWRTVAAVMAGTPCMLDVLLFDRAGALVARYGPHPVS